MKFDVFSWDEVKPNVENQAEKGTLQLRASAQAALYVTAQGVETLAGFASEWSLEISEAVTYRLDAPKGVRLFKYRPFMDTSVSPEGETFTNIDRMPHESGMMAEVTRARRMFEIEKRQMINEIRREASIARKSFAPKRAGIKAEAEAEPAPEIAQGDLETKKEETNK